MVFLDHNVSMLQILCINFHFKIPIVKTQENAFLITQPLGRNNLKIICVISKVRGRCTYQIRDKMLVHILGILPNSN